MILCYFFSCILSNLNFLLFNLLSLVSRRVEILFFVSTHLSVYIVILLMDFTIIWNSSWKCVMFEIVGWVVPNFCSSEFGCECVRKVLHPFLCHWCFRQTLWLWLKTIPLINVGGMILRFYHFEATYLRRQCWRYKLCLRTKTNKE